MIQYQNELKKNKNKTTKKTIQRQKRLPNKNEKRNKEKPFLKS